MHRSAMIRMQWFVQNYIPRNTHVRILDVGSYNVNGCYKPLLSTYDCEYVGLDISAGPNVDIVPKDPYQWYELTDNSFDFVISGNAFEHIEFPWVTIKEIYRVLKKGGFSCILAPFSHEEHRYPVDCYRYLSDGFKALAKWAGFKVVEVTVGGVPSGTTDQRWLSKIENYDDTMGIFAKVDSEEEIKGCPRMRSSNIVHRWALK